MHGIKTQYLTDSYYFYALKMEYVWNFWLKVSFSIVINPTKNIRLKHIWSQTHRDPRHLVPHNGSPINWSLWTNSPQPIRSPRTDAPQKFGAHGQMVTSQFGPPRQMVPRIFHMSRGTCCRDLEIQGVNLLGTICPWGPNLLGTICPGGSVLLGSFVQGDGKSGTGSLGIK